MTAPMVDYKIHWLKMMSVPESRAVVGRHDGINGRDRRGPGDLAGRQLWIAAAGSRRDAGQARGLRAPTGSGAVVPPPRGVGFAGLEDVFHRPRRVPARDGRVVPVLIDAPIRRQSAR